MTRQICLFIYICTYPIEAGECSLLFSAESFVFQFAIQKFKDQDV